MDNLKFFVGNGMPNFLPYFLHIPMNWSQDLSQPVPWCFIVYCVSLISKFCFHLSAPNNYPLRFAEAVQNAGLALEFAHPDQGEGELAGETEMSFITGPGEFSDCKMFGERSNNALVCSWIRCIVCCWKPDQPTKPSNILTWWIKLIF